MMRPLSSPRQGSVIAVTVLFMSFLLIGIVGAAYLLSSHLRITSLGNDYLQASYNAENALELSLYELKHRREGYERAPLELSWDDAEGPDNLMRSEIEYRLGAEQPEPMELLGGSRKLALFYEQQDGTLRDLKDMRGLQIELTASAKTTSTECLQVRLVGVWRDPQGHDIFESISSSLPCGQTRSLGSLTDEKPNTSSLPLRQPYPFSKFIDTHTAVILLVNDATSTKDGILTLKVRGASDTLTIASPTKQVTAEGVFGSSLIRKRIEILQDQLPDLLSRSIVQ